MARVGSHPVLKCVTAKDYELTVTGLKLIILGDPDMRKSSTMIWWLKTKQKIPFTYWVNWKFSCTASQYERQHESALSVLSLRPRSTVVWSCTWHSWALNPLSWPYSLVCQRRAGTRALLWPSGSWVSSFTLTLSFSSIYSVLALLGKAQGRVRMHTGMRRL